MLGLQCGNTSVPIHTLNLAVGLCQPPAVPSLLPSPPGWRKRNLESQTPKDEAPRGLRHNRGAVRRDWLLS